MNPSLRFTVRAPGPLLAVLLLAVFTGLAAHAQTVTQVIRLTNGWNALWIEVQPTDATPATLFAGAPIESAWTFLDRSSSAEFIQNQNELPWNNPSWHRWFPSSSEKALLTTLFAINANSALLVKVTNDFILTVTGVPSLPRFNWKPDAFNLRGFPVDSNLPPVFGAFFANQQTFADQLIYRLRPDGLWNLVAPTDSMRASEAYWVFAVGGSDFNAPLRVTPEFGNALEYGKTVDDQTFSIQNRSSNFVATASANLNPSVNPLTYYDGNDWINFPLLANNSLEAGASATWRIGIRRTVMASPVYETVLQVRDSLGSRLWLPLTVGKMPATETYTGLWVGNVRISGVSEDNVTVMAKTFGGGAAAPARAVIQFNGADNDFTIEARANGDAYNGLNIVVTDDSRAAAVSQRVVLSYARGALGDSLTIGIKRGVTTAAHLLNAVNTFTTNGFSTLYRAVSANGEGSSGLVAEVTPTSDAEGAGSEFNLRLIIHVDNFGQARLLKQVIQLWQDGTYITNTTTGLRSPNPANPGRYVLLTDDSKIIDFQGASLRDGEPVGRRISSVGFDFPNDDMPNARKMPGTFALGGTITNAFELSANWPTNPFRHRMHPDHNDSSPLSFKIRRALTLTFSSTPPSGGAVASDYGYNAMAGNYREVLNGLHRNPIVVAGTFQLQRLSVVGKLNP